MKKLIIELDDATAEELARVAPSLSGKRSEFIRSSIRRALWELEEEATEKAYRNQPDSDSDAYLDPLVWKLPPAHTDDDTDRSPD